MLYKYPHAAYPYADLVAENSRCGFDDFEYELSDTGIFDDQRYFDLFVEYAKVDANDVLVKITAHNRGPMGDVPDRPVMQQINATEAGSALHLSHPAAAEAIRQCGDAYNRARLTPTVKGIFHRLMAFKR